MSDSVANVAGKIILVTGGAQGIGEATARLCAQRGARVILADIKADKGEAVAASIQQSGGDAKFYQVDVRMAEQVSSVFAHVQADYGRLDVLINAAGVLQGQFLQPEEFPLEVFEFVMDVNVKGSFLATKYATPLLAESKGVMILIASGAGVVGGSSSLAYGTSKGAVNGLGMTLESHLKPRGIRVNVVCPGSLRTEMKLGVIKTQAERAGEDYDKVVASSELGDPAGVARLLAFLASDDGDYVRRNMFTR
ncbi:MAG: SDR family NAD(P)-dependent oxidoreductase [Chloroflexi bacterium]|nr:SDR family NAD(P)-dependent oxidoreductase [Chloroflexota bacterium]